LKGLEVFYPARREDLPVVVQEVLFLNDFVSDERFTENMNSLGKNNKKIIFLMKRLF
jgi:hypothetical protein